MIPAKNQENLETTIKRAVELGINHIETARGYGTSEIQLGKVLPTFERDRIIVQTKVTPRKDPKEFLATFEKSIKNLQLDYVDLLGIHGINTHELLDWTLRPGGCMDVVRELQRQGRVHHVGFSTHGPTDATAASVPPAIAASMPPRWIHLNASPMACAPDEHALVLV